MAHDREVKCTVSRYWNPFLAEEEQVYGTLIDISTRSAENGSLIPVGIVILEDGSYQSIPMEYLTEI